MTSGSPSRRLYRSRSDRMLGGVAGGVAAYLQVDPALTRLVFAALVLAGGVGFLAYVVAWIVVPEEPLAPAVPGAGAPLTEGALPASPPPPPPRPKASSTRGARLVVGAVLVGVGCLLLLDWALPDLDHLFWPGAIVVAGLALLIYGARR
jgi:phage shock protein C